MQLTPEQLEKAARIAYEMWHDGYQSWGECPERHKEDMRKAIAAAFAALAQAQVDVPGDLVERMIYTWFATATADVDSHRDHRQRMTAALRVALEDPRVLGKPDDSETDDIVRVKLGFSPSGKVSPDFRYGAKLVLASRRARLLQPKTVEERVTITLQEGDFPYVVSVDGKKISAFGYEHSRDGSGAADFRLSLIAKLKAEGQVSGEAGGNAQ